MSIIKFKKEKSFQNCKLTRISDHIIEIELEKKTKSDILKSGFVILNEHNNSIQGNYSNFTTIYQSFEDSDKRFRLSNDGTVYVEPEPIPEPEPYIPTEEEAKLQLEQNKKSKISLSKTMLAEYLKNNPIHSSAHNNVDGTYSVTNEKQTLMATQYITYQISKASNPETKLTWNETGKVCEEWTEEEFLQLIVEIREYVYPLVSYQQHIEEDIVKCTNQEELDEITIDYSSIK